MAQLHSTTDQVLQAIKASWAAEGYSPSIRDIMAATGITSTSVARYHLLRLERAGVMKRTPGVARSYVLIEKGVKGGEISDGEIVQWNHGHSRIDHSIDHGITSARPIGCDDVGARMCFVLQLGGIHRQHQPASVGKRSSG